MWHQAAGIKFHSNNITAVTEELILNNNARNVVSGYANVKSSQKYEIPTQKINVVSNME